MEQKKEKQIPPWFNLNTNVVGLILYHLLYTYHERDVVFRVWKNSRALQPYLYWYRAAFAQRNSYVVWCKFLKFARKVFCEKQGPRVFGVQEQTTGSFFAIVCDALIVPRDLTNAVPIPIGLTHGFNLDNMEEIHHSHDSFKSVTFAKDDDVFFLVIVRDAIFERCSCFSRENLWKRTQLAAVVMDVEFTEENQFLILKIKWGS